MVGLCLLINKDLRCMIRNKVSLIIELIIIALVLAIIAAECSFCKTNTGPISTKSKYKTFREYESDGKHFFVNFTNNDYDLTKQVEILRKLEGFCQAKFERTPDGTVQSTNVVINAFDGEKLDYEIVGRREKNFLPSKTLQGNIFGDGAETPTKKPNADLEVLFLQNCLNRAFVLNKPAPATVPQLKFGRMPQRKPPGAFFAGTGNILVYLALIVVVLALKEVAAEKLNGVHAYLLAVGLPRYTFLASHFVFAFFKIVFVVIAVSLLVIFFNGVGYALKIAAAFFLYSIALLAFALIIAAICQRSLYVIMAAIAYVLVGNIITMVLDVTCFTQTRALIFSIAHPVCAFSIIMNHYDIALNYDKSVHFFSHWEHYLPIGYPFVFLIGHFFIYMIITFYIDYVVPTDDTPKLHPLFILGFGRKQTHQPDPEEKAAFNKKQQNSRHEEIQATGELQLEVKDLVKKWPNGDVAVNKISFKVHSGQVVALPEQEVLDTTLEKIELNNAAGTLAKNLSGGMKRKLSLGIALISSAKVVLPEQEVLDTTLEKIELNNAAGTLAKNLSGGMKRKLSLGIALISSAKVVLLDEPTAGIDTFARRNMVKVIEKAKADHAVVITTHYMDEADALSDHINIMAHGEIICSGSSEFLKSKFGTGIMLVVDLDLSHREKMDVITKCANEILDVVKKSCPDAEFYGPVASQLSIVIGAKNRPAFPQLFADLESKSAELKIESFDVNMNSLDQVFVNVTKQSEGGDIKADEEIMKFVEKRKECDRGTFLFLTQMKALFIRKFHNFRRDYFQIGVVVIALFLIVTSTIMKKVMKNDDVPVKAVNLSAKATAKLDIADFFKFNVELFPAGDEYDLKSQMSTYLSSSYDIAAVDHDESEDIPTVYKKIRSARWKTPTPTMFFLLNATVSLAMINPGFYHGEYVAQHMFYESFAPGLITGQITYKPVMWGNDIKVPPTITPESKKQKDQSITMLLLVYPLIFALPVFLYTTERVEGAVHLYARTHLTKFTYWITSFLSEFLVFTVFSLVIAFILFSSSFWHISCLGPFILVTLLLSFAFIAQSYAASQIFNSSGVTFTMLMIWNFAIFMVMNLVIDLISVAFEPIIYVKLLMPSLAMFTLFNSLDLRCSAKTTLEDILECGEGCKLHPLALIGGCTAIHLAVLIGVLVYPRILALFTKKVNDTSTATDTPDVTKERERVEQGGIGKHAVVAIGLKKTFGLIWKKKTVVHNVTFGVSKNECFGLLGSNGAGKSTTFNMLTASLRPTAGKAYVGGTSVANSPYIFKKKGQKMSVLYTKLDEIVAGAAETSSAGNSNAPKTSSAQPSSNAPQPSSGAPSAEKTQPGTEGGGKKEKNGVRECIIVGATLEDIFIRLAQSGAPLPKAAFEK
uniref:ABC transporter domain-containing protein n=1 Tax=Panagrellus redivivus TaxID=6233 RepID=A0A7E4ZQS0_PANRE